MNHENVIELHDVEHVYGGNVRALANLSLGIGRGEFVAIIGKNGSGKTTLAKHFNGLLKPANASGRALVRQGQKLVPTKDLRLHQLAGTIGYVFQNPDRQIFHDSCREELEFGLLNLGLTREEAAPRIAETLSLVGLEGREESNPVNLSRGERQRLAIASTLVMDPDVAVIDEPTTGQDRAEGRLILEFLARHHASGKTVVIVSHDMALVAEYATRVIAMRRGVVLADGTPRDVFSQTEVLEQTNIRPPQVAVLVNRLGLPGILTVREAVEVLKAHATAHKAGAEVLS